MEKKKKTATYLSRDFARRKRREKDEEKTGRIEMRGGNAGDLISGNDIIIACPHPSPAEEDAGVGVLLESLARSAVIGLPRPIRLARVYTRIENTLLHLQVAYLFAAGPQYFPFSTISYEFSSVCNQQQASQLGAVTHRWSCSRSTSSASTKISASRVRTLHFKRYERSDQSGRGELRP